MKKQKKIQKNLDDRMKGHLSMVENAQQQGKFYREGMYTAPGSRSGRK